MMPLTSTLVSRSPRFGWFSAEHHHIEAAAIARMPDSPWKQALSGNLPKIQAKDDLQDVIYNGPDHFIGLEARGNTPSLPKPQWAKVQQVFTPSQKESRLASWQKKPLVPATIQEGDSVYRTILETYGLIKKQLHQIAQGSGRLQDVTEKGDTQATITRNEYYQELFANVGKLAHYVGDTFNPHHTTEYYNWPIRPESSKGIHEFLEGQVLDKLDRQKLMDQALTNQNKPLPLVHHKELGKFILGQMQNSFLALFNLVQQQQKVLKDPQATQSAATYENALKQAFKPTAQQQVAQAQETLATLLQSVWEEAGKPTLPANV